ncbi:MAG: N-acetylmuramoyl-L-alanine amidase [Armatimonadetes bacterium]|nr:N-acetylmuramoyl-L-alanine amidase [Armatimonadota bacterium]
MRFQSAARAARSWCALAGLCLAALATAPAAADDSATTKPIDQPALVESLSYRQTDSGLTVRLDLSHPRDPQKTVLREPAKVYFDLRAARLRSDQTQSYPLSNKLVSAVRLGQFTDSPAVARLVFDLRTAAEVTVTQEDGGRTLLFKVGGGGGGTPVAPSPRQPATSITKSAMQAESAQSATLTLGVGASAAVKAFYLTQPDRVVMDVEGAALRAEPPTPAADGLVSAVHMTQFSPDVVRVTVDLRRPCGYAVTRGTGETNVALRLVSAEAKGRLVIIDPGHGGKDPGCSGYKPGLVEKTVVLDIGLRVQRILEAKGVRVSMTRADDTFIVLGDRPALANKLGADLFVSIHCNAMPDDMKGQRSGTELYYYTPQSPDFASVMLQAVSAEAKLPARGTHERAFVVVKGCSMPSVLVETGYLDHAGDGAMLDSPAGRETFARGIAAGVIRYLQARPPTMGTTAASNAPASRAENKG